MYTNSLEFHEYIARFWIGYWEAKLFLIQAFPPDGEYHY